MKHHQAEHDIAPSKKCAPSAPKGGKADSPMDGASADWRTEMIRQTTYSFYEARNFQDGHELDDWLQAESQVDDKLKKSGAAAPKH
jgi:hypothetical protein